MIWGFMIDKEFWGDRDGKFADRFRMVNDRSYLSLVGKENRHHRARYLKRHYAEIHSLLERLLGAEETASLYSIMQKSDNITEALEKINEDERLTTKEHKIVDVGIIAPNRDGNNHVAHHIGDEVLDDAPRFRPIHFYEELIEYHNELVDAMATCKKTSQPYAPGYRLENILTRLESYINKKSPAYNR